ncbi:glycoside hydrolase family 25 protein [Enterococcus lemanii]|uniref:Glycoside hydrolase family 25 protein n=1 Tax=Enterococcus lemanii TaxID=1159752 RepID=A0ABV9MTT9_9ENTE|nr:glycoside hydrolase family 25 protein [Enterococcus lemanii]MBM7709056.1 GH25 family lysozyme M1 (1,4-beta-N-acetylmuramidase) [Enterococcus lemanii]
MLPNPVIIDISEWQVPSKINYDVLAKQIAGVIVRVQYGSLHEDKHYQTHITEFQKRQIPVAVYAWVRGTSLADMQQEARDFYQRASRFSPVFWWLDVEEQSMTDMRNGVEAYRQELKKMGAKKVGAYIANHLYQQFQLATETFEAIWLPTYGTNSGVYNGSNPTATTNYHLHQYTDKGRLSGYSGYLDLNRIVQGNLTTYFGQKTPPQPNQNQIQDQQVYQLQTAVYLRKEPNLNSPSLALLPKDSQVVIDRLLFSEKYLWGRQPRADGSVAYLALGMLQSYVKRVK